MPEILNSIFWIEVGKIKPNPFQPRRDFNEDRLRDLADSIRQYGVLQPLVVTKKEIERPDGSLYSEYELITGERRWRAACAAGVSQVPCVIRSGDDDDRLKLEMAIIENLQREDLNPVDRARAFDRLVKEFSLKHADIAGKVGKSREFVSNSLRILALGEEFLKAIVAGEISEGHTRPLLMLNHRPVEQKALFEEIIARRLTTREAEAIARRAAIERSHKRSPADIALWELEKNLSDKLGTRVQIEPRQAGGGRVTISYLSPDNLQEIINVLLAEAASPAVQSTGAPVVEPAPALEEDLYNIKNFSL